jgi:hypothetical protein
VFTEYGISYAHDVDWEAPGHTGSEPDAAMQPAAAPTAFTGEAAEWNLLPADEDPADRDQADRDQADQEPVDEDWADQRRADQDPAERPRARHSAVRTRRAVPRLAAPRITAPRITRPRFTGKRLAADPRTRIWATRAAIALGLYLVFTMWIGWRLGLTVAALYVALDIIFRSKTGAAVPPAIMVTTAQKSTARRLKVLQPAGYLSLNACTVPGMRPGTRSIIDHFVVGPAGLFVLDSERWDRRLPIRTIGGKLYHGPVNQEERLKHSRWEAHHAAALISGQLGRPVKVRSAMVIYGPRVPWVVSKLQGVDVFDGGRVGTYFRRQSKAAVGRQLDAGQVAIIYAAAAHALPPAQ